MGLTRFLASRDALAGDESRRGGRDDLGRTGIDRVRGRGTRFGRGPREPSERADRSGVPRQWPGVAAPRGTRARAPRPTDGGARYRCARRERFCRQRGAAVWSARRRDQAGPRESVWSAAHDSRLAWRYKRSASSESEEITSCDDVVPAGAIRNVLANPARFAQSRQRSRSSTVTASSARTPECSRIFR
jgi:hypothetical protein